MNYDEIKKKRLEYRLSQNKLAELSGYSAPTISGWERGIRTPSETQLAALSEALDNAIAALEAGDNSIRKKRITKNANNPKRTTPPIITSPAEYKKLNKKSSNPYAELLERELGGGASRVGNSPKAISLFSGCGGMTLGFQSAGFDVVGHVEINESANKIFEANFPSCDLLGTDIEKVSDDIVKGWIRKYGQIDVVVGGPPCQGFSLAGKRDPNDARSQLYKQYARMVSIIKPKVLVLENVRLLTSMKDRDGGLFLDKIIAAFSEIGYESKVHLVNAQNYGVPQSRERMIIVGVRRDMASKYVFPPASHDGVATPFRTFREATSDLDSIESGESSPDPMHWAVAHPDHVINWLKDVPEGCSAHDNEDPSKRPPSGFNTTYKRITWDEPCSTISTNFGMISGCRNVHPQQTRSLTIREATRAQSFPDSFVFLGSWGDVRKAIGNAVPPLLAKTVANSLRNQLF